MCIYIYVYLLYIFLSSFMLLERIFCLDPAVYKSNRQQQNETLNPKKSKLYF